MRTTKRGRGPPSSSLSLSLSVSFYVPRNLSAPLPISLSLTNSVSLSSLSLSLPFRLSLALRLSICLCLSLSVTLLSLMLLSIPSHERARRNVGCFGERECFRRNAETVLIAACLELSFAAYCTYLTQVSPPLSTHLNSLPTRARIFARLPSKTNEINYAY